MDTSTKAYLPLARRAARVHFCIAFFPTLTVLVHLALPGIELGVGKLGLIALCISVLTYTALLLIGLIRREDQKALGRSMGWVVAAQGAFWVQAMALYLLLDRMAVAK